jgi:hypothetical protein
MRRALGRPVLATTLAMLLALSTACAGASGSARGPRRDPNVITREELASRPFASLFEAVEMLHSNWLQTRGTDSINQPSQIWVYLDGTRLGGIESLRTLTPSSIMSVQRIDAVTATGRWGIGHGQGVILVTSSPR